MQVFAVEAVDDPGPLPEPNLGVDCRMDPNAAADARAAVVADAPPLSWLARQRPASAAAVLVAGAVAVCASLALALAELLAPAGRWAAPLAAAIGMLVVMVPLAAVLLKLARHVEQQRRQLDAAAAVEPADWLVGRPAFVALAEREWARARRYGGGIAVLVIEVDRWRKLAEARGPAAAEALVVGMAGHTSSTLRGGDALARLSDSQLAVFLAQADATGTLDAAERIRERLEQLSVPWQDTTLRATVSIGAATMNLAHANVPALVDDAQFAVLLARQAGGNCVRTPPPGAKRLQSPGSSVDDNQRAGPL
jgi:diguanylate cyclase (GGDEF)-like protein